MRDAEKTVTGETDIHFEGTHRKRKGKNKARKLTANSPY
jgi:hypothetical protein